MPRIDNVENVMWRVGSRNENEHHIYAMIFNDEGQPSKDDILIGSMDTPELSKSVVDMHNRLIRKFGRHYPRFLERTD